MLRAICPVVFGRVGVAGIATTSEIAEGGIPCRDYVAVAIYCDSDTSPYGYVRWADSLVALHPRFGHGGPRRLDHEHEGREKSKRGREPRAAREEKGSRSSPLGE